MISRSSQVVAVKDLVSSDLGDEVVILNLRSGTYYGLDPVGARIWSLLQERRTVAEICDNMLEEYDVDSERCEHDVLALLEDLAAHGLVEASHATSR